MSKRKNYKKNSSVKKFFRKPIVMMTAVALVVVVICGMLGNLTNGFTDLDTDNFMDRLSTIHINQKNLFFDVIEDKTLLDNSNVTAKAEDGVITLKANIDDTDKNATTVAETITFATVKLTKGTYTLTAMKKVDWKTCCVVGTYTVNGTTHTWYADYTDTEVDGFNKSETVHGCTLDLEADTEVTFSIRVCEGAKLDNIKITPVLVEGKDAGNYFAGLLGLIG